MFNITLGEELMCCGIEEPMEWVSVDIGTDVNCGPHWRMERGKKMVAVQPTLRAWEGTRMETSWVVEVSFSVKDPVSESQLAKVKTDLAACDSRMLVMSAGNFARVGSTVIMSGSGSYVQFGPRCPKIPMVVRGKNYYIKASQLRPAEEQTLAPVAEEALGGSSSSSASRLGGASGEVPQERATGPSDLALRLEAGRDQVAVSMETLKELQEQRAR